MRLVQRASEKRAHSSAAATAKQGPADIPVPSPESVNLREYAPLSLNKLSAAVHRRRRAITRARCHIAHADWWSHGGGEQGQAQRDACRDAKWSMRNEEERSWHSRRERRVEERANRIPSIICEKI